MSTSTISVSFEVRYSDYLLLGLRSLWATPARAVQSVSVPLLIFAGLAYGSRLGWGFLTVGEIALLAIVWVIFVSVLFVALAAWVRFKDDSAQGQRCQIVFTKAGLERSINMSVMSAAWAEITSVRERHCGLYVWRKQRPFVIVPRRAFRSPTVIKDLRDLLRQALNKRASLQ